MANRTALPATIAATGTTSNAVDLLGYDVVAVRMPAAWDLATISFTTSEDGVTYVPVKKEDGTALSLTVAASDWTVVPEAYTRGFGRFVKVVSSAAQAAERIVKVIGSA